MLLKKRPNIVFVMSPPIFACIPAWVYTRIVRKTGYIIDVHTGSILNPMWKKVMFVHRFFSGSAITNLVTNDYLLNIVSSWSAKALIVKDVPIIFGKSDKDAFTRIDCIDIVLVNTFAIDEPLDLFLEAVKELPYKIAITGKIPNRYKKKLQQSPPNVTFTDYLSEDDYAKYLKRTKFVMTLTTKDNQMQRGVYEAIYNGIPAITSNHKFLRETFYKGVLFVNNEADDIMEGIIIAMKNYGKLSKEAKELKKEKLEEWRQTKIKLLNLVSHT